jgi:hypothetical protein
MNRITSSASGSKKLHAVPEPQHCSGSGIEIKYNGHKNAKNNYRIRIRRRIRSQQGNFSQRVYTANLGSFAHFKK